MEVGGARRVPEIISLKFQIREMRTFWLISIGSRKLNKRCYSSTYKPNKRIEEWNSKVRRKDNNLGKLIKGINLKPWISQD